MSEVMHSRIFICIVQVSSLATPGIGQHLLTFWSLPEQSWMCALIVAALKITYIVMFVVLLTTLNLKGIVT